MNLICLVTIIAMDVQFYLTLMIIALMLSSLNWLIYFSLQKGNILDFISNFVDKKIKSDKLKKLFGGCIYCFGFWIAFLISACLGLNLFYILFVCSFNFLFTMMIDKHLADILF